MGPREPARGRYRRKGMKTSLLLASILSLAVVATACGSAPPSSAIGPSPEKDQLYEGTGLVLDTPDRDPELCLGAVNDSLPPQCGGIPLIAWDWTQVEGEDEAMGTKWGGFHVMGSYDGETLTVHEAGPPANEDPSGSDPIDTPCPEPAGGWRATDPARASQEDVADVQREVSRDPDFAGLWIDYYDEPPGGPTEEDPGDIILNVAFTDDLERHERELRALWGGALCLSQHDHTEEELQRIQNGFPDEFDVDVLWSSIDVVRGVVEIGVITIDAETLQRIDDRYGEGVVKVDARLKPVD